MRRADRLFQIIQILRRSTRPVTAAALAEELEVSTRTVYRDVADLMGQRVPIEGEAGLGYLLASDYDMPPLMLTPDEIEAVMLGAQWVAGRSDMALSNAARDVMAKIAAVVPERLRPFIVEPTVGVKPTIAETAERVDPSQPQIGDPQRSEAASALSVRGWRRKPSGLCGRSSSAMPRRRGCWWPGASCVRASGIFARIGSSRWKRSTKSLTCVTANCADAGSVGARRTRPERGGQSWIEACVRGWRETASSAREPFRHRDRWVCGADDAPYRPDLMEWMPPPDGIAMCQGGDGCTSHE